MALIVNKETLPGYKTAKFLYDLLPGSGTVKKVIVGVTVGALVLAGIAAGCVGVAALLTWVGGSLLGSTLIASGVIAALPILFGFLAAGVRTAYTFNWNATDAELDQIIEANVKNLYGVLGEAAGQAVGQFIGGAAGKSIYLVNPAAAKLITKDLSEERKDEVWGNLAAIHQSGQQLLANYALTSAFKSARRWLKDPSSPFYSILKNHLGENFTKWGDEGQPSFTISKHIEEKIETIPDESTRNFTENFVEGLFEGLNETLNQTNNSIRNYMVAQGIMDYYRINPAMITARIRFNRNEPEQTS